MSSVVVKGRTLQCNHCSGLLFTKRTGKVEKPWLGFDWMDPAAVIYVCNTCGHMHWFMEPEVVSYSESNDGMDAVADLDLIDDTSEPTVCLACGKMIAAGKDTCEDCGWSYRSKKED